MYRNHAFAKSTAASYNSQLRAYLRFCLFFGYTPVPCRAIHLLRYIVFLARTLSTRSIPNYLNVVRLLHLQHGYPNPLKDPLFKHQKTLLMRGIKRINRERVTQKLPITPDVLHKMQCHLHLDSSFDATFWAACLVAFFSFFRKSNLLPPSATCGNAMFDCSRGASFLLFVGLKRSNTEVALSWLRFRRLLTPPCVLGQR